MKITEAITILIKTQNENTIPDSNILKTIFSLSQKEFEKLNSNEKTAIAKLYQKVRYTDLVRRPDWAKPFLAFQKAFPIFQKTISNENDPTREQIQRGLTRHTSGPMHDIFMRMQAFLDDPSKPLDLSNLGLDSLPSFLLTDSRFAEANITGNAINKLPNIKIGALCNEKIYEEMIKKIPKKNCEEMTEQISKKNPPMNLPVEPLVATFSFLEELPPILGENKNLIKAAGLSCQEHIRKLLKETPRLSRFIPADFSLETAQENMTADFVGRTEACLNSLKEAKDRQETSLIAIFPTILKQLSETSQTAWEEDKSWTQAEKAQAMRSYLTTHKEDCSSITELNLSRKNLTEIPLEVFDNFTNLQKLNAAQNKLEVIPPEIGNLTKLEELLLFSNKIKIIPPEIGKLKNLGILHLPNNKIEVIPPEIGSLTNLEELLLFSNNIKIIPPEISNLTNLLELHVGGNKLVVFPQIRYPQYLQRLYLAGNKIEVLPYEISNLRHLQRLTISSCSLKKRWLLGEESVEQFRKRLLIRNQCKIECYNRDPTNNEYWLSAGVMNF